MQVLQERTRAKGRGSQAAAAERKDGSGCRMEAKGNNHGTPVDGISIHGHEHIRKTKRKDGIGRATIDRGMPVARHQDRHMHRISTRKQNARDPRRGCNVSKRYRH